LTESRDTLIAVVSRGVSRADSRVIRVTYIVSETDAVSSGRAAAGTTRGALGRVGVESCARALVVRGAAADVDVVRVWLVARGALAVGAGFAGAGVVVRPHPNGEHADTAIPASRAKRAELIAYPELSEHNGGSEASLLQLQRRRNAPTQPTYRHHERQTEFLFRTIRAWVRYRGF
jgi:hypothetical protein